ncbi:lysostaphin resistance A-like protein [Chloroflexota bacterium]
MTEPGDSLNGRVWGFWATAGFGLVISVVYFVTAIIVAVAFIVVRIISGSTFSLSQLGETLGDNGLFLSLATFATTIVCVGLITIIVKVRRGATIVEYLGFRRITRKTMFIFLAVSAGFIILSDCLSLILGKPLNSEFMVNTYNTSVWPPLFWVAVIIFAPAFEETFFRSFLFEGFRQSRIGLIGTIGLTALIWAILHMQYDIYGIVTIFVTGILLGIVRFKTGSLWSPLLMHVFFNFVATLQVAININSLVS